MGRNGFDEFVTHSPPALGRYGHVLTGNAYDAVDLVQDALVRVFRAWHRVRQDGNPLGNTKQAMVRLHLSSLRQLRRRLNARGLADTAVEGAGLARVDALGEFRGAPSALSPLQRVVLVLSYLDDATDEAIAEILSREPATIRALRQRGLSAIRTRVNLREKVSVIGRCRVQGYEDAVREMFRSARYELAMPSQPILEQVRRRHRRFVAGSTAAVVLGLTLAAGTGYGALNAAGPESPGSTAGVENVAAQPVQATHPRILGVPTGLMRTDDLRAVTGLAQPADGEKVVFQAAGTSVLVVTEPSTMPGLPGQSVDVPWPVGPGSPQFYLNATGDATFLTACTPAGAKWFIAVNGCEAATRLATVSSIAQASSR